MTGCYTRTYKKQIEDSNETFSLQLSLPCFLHIYILAVNKLCCEGFIISHQHAKNKDTKIYVISSLFAYNLILQNHRWFHMGNRNWSFTKGSLTKGVTPLGRCDRLPHHILNHVVRIYSILEFQQDESRGSHNKESLPPPCQQMWWNINILNHVVHFNLNFSHASLI